MNFKYLLSSFAAPGEEFEISAIPPTSWGVLNVLVWFNSLISEMSDAVENITKGGVTISYFRFSKSSPIIRK